MTRGNERREKTQEFEAKSKSRLRKSITTAFKAVLGFSKHGSPSETDSSLSQHELILRANPEDKDAWMNLARLFHKKFQFEKAVECKLRASDLSPNDPEVKFSLGCSFCAKGDFFEAIKCFLEAVKLRPDYAEACEGLADQYLIIGEEEKADEWLLKAREIKLAQTKILS